MIKLFLTGLTLGSGPCLLVCLPLLVPVLIGRAGNWRESLKLVLLFSAGRLVIYCLLGLLAFFAFQFFLSTSLRFYFKLAVGIFIILNGFLPLLGKKFPAYCQLIKRFSSLNFFLLGALIGLLPCGPLLGVLTYIAAIAKNALTSLLWSFAFGLGTFISPLLLAGPLAGFFTAFLKKFPGWFFVLQILSALILFYFGLTVIFSFNVL